MAGMTRDQQKAMFAKKDQGSAQVPKMDKRFKGINTSDGSISERDINLLRRRMHDGKISEEEASDLIGEGLKIQPEQEQKGLAWLNNQRRTPGGKERKNNPFGAREEEILDDFSHFELIGFEPQYDPFDHKLMFTYPIYEVRSNRGSGFEYRVKAGAISIIG